MTITITLEPLTITGQDVGMVLMFAAYIGLMIWLFKD